VLGVHTNVPRSCFIADGPTGADDGNSWKGVAQPWLRSLDALNTHDDSVRIYDSGSFSPVDLPADF
jgi:hypothetical protein